MTLLVIVLLILIYSSWIGVYKMFEKAGRPGWAALIPFYNFYVWLKVIGGPMYWFLLLFVPIINVFIYAYMHIDLVRSFGKKELKDHAASIIIPFFFFPKIGFSSEDKYIGPGHTFPKEKKSVAREWTEAAVFAIVAATLIRWLTFEAYVIPTPSMESSLMVGDYLFVSKVHYGARTPKTILQLPLTHQTIPLTNMQSYLDWIQLKQYRLPGLTEVKRNDVVVFNFPKEMDRPTDLKTNYIKRCMAIGGDMIQIKNREVFVNDEHIPLPAEVQFSYYIQFKPGRASNYNVKKIWTDFYKDPEADITNAYEDGIEMSLTPQEAEEITKYDFVQQVTLNLPINRNPVLYPFIYKDWTQDNYGPLYVPKKGDALKIDAENLAIYEVVLKNYEGLTNVDITGGKLSIDGKEVKEYNFKQNYYFMMGDNRHNSLDSRYWGFVPEDHIVGKAVFVWLSVDKDQPIYNKVRWKRIFNIIK